MAEGSARWTIVGKAPGQASFNGVGYTSFTVTWGTNGNLGYTPYEVSRSTSNDGFATAVSTPIQLSDNFTSNTTIFLNLTPATTYYLRIRAQNGDTLFI